MKSTTTLFTPMISRLMINKRSIVLTLFLRPEPMIFVTLFQQLINTYFGLGFVFIGSSDNGQKSPTFIVSVSVSMLRLG